MDVLSWTPPEWDVKVPIPKREAELKSALMEEIAFSLHRYWAFRHEDIRRKAIPDISLTGHKFTSWWEAKHATPTFFSFGLQELTCRRLAVAGYCRYIVYFEVGCDLRTLIVHPRHLHELTPEVEVPGHDHRFVAEFMRKVHEDPAVRLRERIID